MGTSYSGHFGNENVKEVESSWPEEIPTSSWRTHCVHWVCSSECIQLVQGGAQARRVLAEDYGEWAQLVTAMQRGRAGVAGESEILG